MTPRRLRTRLFYLDIFHFFAFLPLDSQYLALRFSAIIRPKSAPYKKLFKYFKSESVISFISKMFYLQVNRDRQGNSKFASNRLFYLQRSVIALRIGSSFCSTGRTCFQFLLHFGPFYSVFVIAS